MRPALSFCGCNKTICFMALLPCFIHKFLLPYIALAWCFVRKVSRMQFFQQPLKTQPHEEVIIRRTESETETTRHPKLVSRLHGVILGLRLFCGACGFTAGPQALSSRFRNSLALPFHVGSPLPKLPGSAAKTSLPLNWPGLLPPQSALSCCFLCPVALLQVLAGLST